MTGFENINIPDVRAKEARTMVREPKAAKPEVDSKTSSLARAEARLREIRESLPEGEIGRAHV